MLYAVRSLTGFWISVGALVFNNVSHHLLTKDELTEEIQAEASKEKPRLEILEVSGPEDPQLGGKKLTLSNLAAAPAPAPKAEGPQTMEGDSIPKTGTEVPADGVPSTADARAPNAAFKDEFRGMKQPELRAKALELGLPEFPKVARNADIADAIRAKLAESPKE